MKMTEKQAAEVWCPMVRRFPEGFNRDGIERFSPDLCCIARRCAFWRWARNEDGRPTFTSEREPLGYCGAGGKP